MISKILVLIFLFIIFYSYIGYAMLSKFILLFDKRKNIRNTQPAKDLSVTLIVASYNEEDILEEKILNTLKISYPPDLLKIIFITDGSTDSSALILRKYPQILHLHQDAREGKSAAVTRAISFVTSEIVVFSDANTMLNTNVIHKIVDCYSDPKVGAVAGEKRIMKIDQDTSSIGEGMYWQYESFLKRADSNFYSVVGAAGELFSVRTRLYQHPGNDVILDDFIISLSICKNGYKVRYEPDAYALENPSQNIAEEQKRKVRISAGAFQAMYKMRSIIFDFKQPRLVFLYLSHRVFRWTICPITLPLLFVLNFYTIREDRSVFFISLFLAQSIFYFLSIIGYLNLKFKFNFKPAQLAYYFVFMNISLYRGFFKYIQNRQTVLWDKSVRKQI